MSEPTTTEVRAWARDQGMEVPDRGRLPADVWSQFATAHAGMPLPPPEDNGEIIMDIDVPDVPQRPEKPPEAPSRRRLRDRVREAAKPRDGKAPRKRVSLETLCGLAWSGAAGLLGSLTGTQYMPVTMMMSFQAPIAGAVLEDVARGTVADKVLQPFARLVQPGGQVAALVGAPLGTAIVCRYPHLYPRVRPMIAQAMREYVIVAGPKLREMRRREEKFAAEMASFKEEFGVTIDELLDQVFAPVLMAMQAEQAATNGHAPAAA